MAAAPPGFLKKSGFVVFAWFCVYGASLAQNSGVQGVVEPVSRPNIVLILADDLGFTDIAPYGSEIRTPTLTALAESGVRFTNYHTGASCAPSRAMLMTGVDNHRAGVPNIPEMIPPEQKQYENYRGTLGLNVVTVASLLQDAGYHTYMAGKWHLGKTPDLLPSRRGFERTLALADSGADNWEQKPYLPIYEKANWFADGQETKLPEDFYSSRYLVDKTIEFIDSNREDGRPFFAYLPFLAVHIPVQAPQAFIDRYMGVYDAGWDELRKRRHARAVELGIVPAGTSMVRMPTTRDWGELTADQKRYQAKRMAVYAGMVEAMDYHMGRLLDYLQRTGEYDNTVFIFTSDNGSEASEPADPDSFVSRMALSRQGYTNDYETLGLKGSFNTIGASFASASAAPLAFYKFYTGEGGMRVPLIIAGRSIAAKAQFTHAFSYVTDIAPTILQLSGVEAPSRYYGGRPVEPISGRSLVPLLEGSAARVYAEHDAVAYELAGNAVLFQGDYKIVLNRPPVGDNRWRLFNIVTDPGEAEDLSAVMPERLQRMLGSYQRYVDENGILPAPAGYDPQRQVVLNGLRYRFGPSILLALLALLVLTPFYLVYRFTNRE